MSRKLGAPIPPPKLPAMDVEAEAAYAAAIAEFHRDRDECLNALRLLRDRYGWTVLKVAWDEHAAKPDGGGAKP